MENNNKSFKLVAILKSMIKPKQTSKEGAKPKHQPSWMYRNE